MDATAILRIAIVGAKVAHYNVSMTCRLRLMAPLVRFIYISLDGHNLLREGLLTQIFYDLNSCLGLVYK